MKKSIILKVEHAPTRFPITFTLATYLFFDKLQIEPIWWGVYWTVIVILWLISIFGFIKNAIHDKHATITDSGEIKIEN